MRGSGPRDGPSVGRGVPAFLALLAACTTLPPEGRPTPGPTPTAPSSLRIGVLSSGSLDPRELDTPESLFAAAQVFDGLVAYDPSTSAVLPAVAERWDVLEGGRRFVFHLRRGVAFHDGSPVRARDFLFSWTRLADPGRPSPFAFLLEPIDGFREYHVTLKQRVFRGLAAPDDATFEVRLAAPWPDFVALLGHPALSPVPASADRPGFASLPTGNGPYRVAAEVVPGAPIPLVRHDGYYGTPARVQSVELRVHTTPEEAWPGFLSGELDVAPIPASVLPDARAEFGPRGLSPVGRVLYCGFNQSVRRLRNPKLRTAVSLALDRAALAADVYGELALPATGFVPPRIPGHEEDACGDACRPDLARAAEIAGRLPKAARAFLLDYSDSPIGRRLAEALAARLAEAGLTATPRAHTEADLARALAKKEQELYCLVWVADYPRQQAFLEPLLSSSSPDNRSGFSSPDLDGLLAFARSEDGPAEREQRYREVERRALALSPLLPLAWFRARLAAKPYVQGFVLDPLGGFDASALTIGR